MRHHLTGLLLVAAACAQPACAQDVWDEAGGIETAAAADATLVWASDVPDIGGEPVVYTLKGAFEANFILENGAEVGLRTSGGLDGDNPARAGFSGVFPAASPGAAGGFSGLARGAAIDDTGPRARVETAYIYIDGGYGEVRAGLDDGMAARFFEGAPSLYRRAGLVNPGLDPTGRVLARTDHDLTGPSLKFSYATPRILGVRAGVSFTPEANSGGLDRDPVRGLNATAPVVEDAVEVALNVSRRLPRSGVRLRAGAAWSQASAEAALLPGVYGDIETWSAGGSAEFSSVAAGVSYLTSNNGYAAGGGDYRALSGALRLTLGQYDLGLEAADSEDEGLGAESDAIAVSVGRNVAEGVRLVGGWQRQNTRLTGTLPLLSPGLSPRTDGIVIEITLSR